MSISTFAANKENDKSHGDVNYSPPVTWHYALHICTQLAVALTAPDDVITTDHPISVGATVIVDPDTGLEETRTVLSITGAGPYTVTLSSNLANNHALGAYVDFDLGTNGQNLLEPSGGAYARQSLTNNVTNFPSSTGGAEINATAISFPIPTALWGKLSRLVELDAASGGNVWFWGRTATRPVLDVGAAAGPSFAVGNIVITRS